MLSLTASDIMTREVVTIRKGASIDQALKTMACSGISGMPVVDTEGCLVGIITESDLLLKGQYLPSEHGPKSTGVFAPQANGVEEAHRRAQSELVEDAMTRRVLTFAEESLVVDIARAMIEHAVNRVPILRDCKVVGIISRRDVVMALAQEANGANVCGVDEVHTGRLVEL